MRATPHRLRNLPSLARLIPTTLALIGSAFCFLGVFAPVASARPVARSVNPDIEVHSSRIVLPAKSSCQPGNYTDIYPCSSSENAPTSATGETVVYTVFNNGTSTAGYDLLCLPTGKVTGCNLSRSFVQITAGGSAEVTATYSTSSTAGSGSLSFTAQSSSDLAMATTSIAVLEVAVTVSPVAAVATPRTKNTTGHSEPFIVKNSGPVAATYSISCSGLDSVTCTGTSASSVALGVGDSTTVTASFNAGAVGTGTLRLTASRGGVSDIGSYSVQVVSNSFMASVSSTASSKYRQDASLCVGGCFDATYSQSTVPYFSLGNPRSVTYVYHGDRVAVRPFIYADATPLPGRPAPDEYRLEAAVDWGTGAYTRVTFLNGDDTLYFSGSAGSGTTGATVRLAGQFDASTYPTGAYRMVVTVTAKYGSSDLQQYKDSSAKLIVVNDGSSPFGRGWTLAELDRLFLDGNTGSALLVEGAGAAVYFEKATGGSFTSPVGEFSRLARQVVGSDTTYTRSFPDSSSVTFNVSGRMKSATDRWGNEVEYDYDTQLRLSSISDPFREYSGSPTYTCIRYLPTNPPYFVVGQVQEPGTDGEPCTGRLTSTLVSSADGTLIRIVDPDGLGTNFTYDSNHRLVRVIGKAQDTTQYVYRTDDSWKLASIVMPSVPIDNGGGDTTMQTPTVSYSAWQVVGVPTSSTSSTSATPVVLDSVKAAVIGPLGDTTTFVVDHWGQPLEVTDPLGNVTTIERGGTTGLFATKVTSPLGQVDEYGYTGPFLTFSHPHDQPSTSISYDAWGMPDSVSGGGNPTQTFEWNGTTKTITAKIDNSYPTVNYLDTLGRVTRVEDPAAHNTYYHYEPTFGNLDSTSNTAHQWTKIKYDRYGRDSASVANGQPTRRRIYDILNRDSLFYDGVNTSPTRFTYSPTRTEVRDPKGQLYRTDMNKLGWATVVYDPSDTVSWTKKQSYRYDLAGQVTNYQGRRGYWIEMQYDALGRLTSRRDPLAPADSFRYSPDGRVVVGSNSISVDSVITGMDGSDTVVTWISGKRFKRVHTSTAGKTADTTTITTTASGLAFLSRRYFWSQNRGVLDSIAVGSQKVKFGYDGELLRNTVTYPSFARRDSTTTSHQSYFTSYSTSSLDTLFQRSYAIDRSGRITSEARPKHYQLEAREYGYNGLGALKRYSRFQTDTIQTCQPYMDESGEGHLGCEVTSSSAPDETHHYGYDEVSNLTSDADSVSSTTVNGTFDTGNRLTDWGNVTYDYDADGNRIERDSASGTTYYDWTASGQLYRVRAGSDTISYDYNAFGELVRRSTDGTPDRIYLWDQGQLLAVLNGTATAKLAEYAYKPGVDQPLSYITGNTGGTIRYFQTDERGNVIGLVSGSLPKQHLLYDPWGEIEADWGVPLDSTGLGWKGLLRESGSGLYYVRARWYDTQSRSYISEDPIGISGGLNTYAFSGNDPVNGSDPSGLSPTGCIHVYKVDDAYGTHYVYIDGPCPDGGGEGLPGPDTGPIGGGPPPAGGPHPGGGGGGGGGVELVRHQSHAATLVRRLRLHLKKCSLRAA